MKYLFQAAFQDNSRNFTQSDGQKKEKQKNTTRRKKQMSFAPIFYFLDEK